jgi:gluconokinase
MIGRDATEVPSSGVVQAIARGRRGRMRKAKDSHEIRVVILMGVSGSGKSTIGRRLAEDLGWQFLEGDDFHAPESLDKMRHGVALNDQDRGPWIEVLREVIRQISVTEQRAVIACSALKAAYRDRLTMGVPHVALVYLRGGPDLIRQRLQLRTGHFMKVGLLESQFLTLEEPQNVPVVDVDLSPDVIVHRIKKVLQLDGS